MNASSVEAREVQIAGSQFRCQVCDYTRFFRREADLSTGASSSFGQDWANSKASCFICEQWFVRARAAAMAAEDTTLAVEIENLRKRLEAEFAEDAETAETARR